MSSFICSAKHFNSVERGLMILFAETRNYAAPWDLREISPILYEHRYQDEKTLAKEIKRFMNALRKLNALCVTLQYQHHYEGRVDQEIKEQTEILLKSRAKPKDLHPAELYNALRCIRYQIEIHHLKELRDLTKLEQDALRFLEIMCEDLPEHVTSEMGNERGTRWSID